MMDCDLHKVRSVSKMTCPCTVPCTSYLDANPTCASQINYSQKLTDDHAQCFVYQLFKVVTLPCLMGWQGLRLAVLSLTFTAAIIV